MDVDQSFLEQTPLDDSSDQMEQLLTIKNGNSHEKIIRCNHN